VLIASDYSFDLQKRNFAGFQAAFDIYRASPSIKAVSNAINEVFSDDISPAGGLGRQKTEQRGKRFLAIVLANRLPKSPGNRADSVLSLTTIPEPDRPPSSLSIASVLKKAQTQSSSHISWVVHTLQASQDFDLGGMRGECSMMHLSILLVISRL
jgi:hypothetical protein